MCVCVGMAFMDMWSLAHISARISTAPLRPIETSYQLCGYKTFKRTWILSDENYVIYIVLSLSSLGEDKYGMIARIYPYVFNGGGKE